MLTSACGSTRLMFDYPETRTTEQVDLLHGVRVEDPYRWLEDDKAAEVQRWMTAQDEFTRRQLRSLPERDELQSRLAELMYVDAMEPPTQRGGRYFYERRGAREEKATVYWREGREGADKVLLAPLSWSEDGSVALSGWTPSPDGKKVAFRKSRNNSDDATLYVLDVDSAQVSEVDVIDGARYADPAWLPDSSGFFYQRLPTDPSIADTERPGYGRIFFHVLGTSPEKDPLFRDKTGDSAIFLDARVSSDGRWLILDVDHGWTATDVWLMDLQKPEAERTWQALAVGRGHHYYVKGRLGHLYVMTDEGASRYRLFRVRPDSPARSDWEEIVPESTSTLESFDVLGGHLVLRYLENAASVVEVRTPDGAKVRRLDLPDLGSVNAVTGTEKDDEVFFSFESFTRPQQVFATRLSTGHTELFAEARVPVKADAFTVRQVFFTSKDGTRVPMFLVAPKGFVRDSSARVLLYGYGGFQISLTPRFHASIVPWVERGGVYAVANLRGGNEYGEAWHRAGMREQKQNVFEDFAAAMEYLHRERYTRPENLSIVGRSNGGLLVGAMMVQRPDLFGAGICGVPLLDMLRYHLVGAGKTWVSEYGSAENEPEFRTLHAYSPYHHVERAGRTAPYPALMLSSADSDDRVDPMHARKFAAALQATGAGGPILLRIERNAGHGGADLVRAGVEKYADELAFLLRWTKPAAAGAQ